MRRSDEENPVGADQSCHTPGDQENIFRQAGTLDLLSRGTANPDFYCVWYRSRKPATSNCQNRERRREGSNLPGSAGDQARHDERRSASRAKEAADYFYLG